MIAPRIAPPTAAPPIFLRALIAGRVAVAVDRLRAERHLGAVREHERVEPDAESRRVLDLSAAIHQDDRSHHACAGGNGALPTSHDVTRYARFDAIFKVRRLARERTIDLEADDGGRRNDHLDELWLRGGRRRFGRPCGAPPSEGRSPGQSALPMYPGLFAGRRPV